MVGTGVHEAPIRLVLIYRAVVRRKIASCVRTSRPCWNLIQVSCERAGSTLAGYLEVSIHDKLRKADSDRTGLSVDNFNWSVEYPT